MEDIINKTFNELTILECIDRPETATHYKSWNTNNWVRCKCSCGNIIEYPLFGVCHGIIKSCGHKKVEKAIENLSKVRREIPPLNSVYLSYKGETLSISEWSRKLGIPRTTIIYRLRQNQPMEQVLEKNYKKRIRNNENV